MVVHISLLVQCQRGRALKGDGIGWLPVNCFIAIGISVFVTTFNTQRGEVPGLIIAGLITVEMALRTIWRKRAQSAAEEDEGLLARSLVAKSVCAGAFAV